MPECFYVTYYSDLSATELFVLALLCVHYVAANDRISTDLYCLACFLWFPATA
jgi:hypothetical protein